MFSFPQISWPSLPSLSLPQNVQRRIISFILQRAIGNYFVVGNDSNPTAGTGLPVFGDLNGGKLVLNNVELNVEVGFLFINDLAHKKTQGCTLGYSTASETTATHFTNW